MVYPIPGHKTSHSHARSYGFTLIEIAIVIVIIGLIIGGIVAGQTLIRAAEIRAIVADREKYETAVQTFRTKYGCLPGDCSKASILGFGATNGTGNSVIGCLGDYMDECFITPNAVNATSTSEYVNFWYHLSQANFISYNAVTFDSSDLSFNYQTADRFLPLVKLKPSYWAMGWAVRGDLHVYPSTAYYAKQSAHHFVFAHFSSPFSSDPGTFYPADMYALDAKMDDGLPLSGVVKAIRNMEVAITEYRANINIGSGGTGTTVCVNSDTDPPSYNVLHTGALISGCTVLIKTSF